SRASSPALSTFQCCTESGCFCNFAMTSSSLTGAAAALPPLARARAPLPLYTWAFPRAPPVMLPSAAWPSRLPGSSAAGAAPRLVTGNALVASLIAGVADAQLGGTDNLPTRFDSPTPADTALLRPAPRMPSPAPSADFGISRPSTGAFQNIFNSVMPRLIGLMLSLATVLKRPMSARIPKVSCQVSPANGEPVRVLSTWSQNSMYPREAFPIASSNCVMMSNGKAAAAALGTAAAVEPLARPLAWPTAAAWL